MAIKLENKPNVEAPSVDYPFGSIRNTVGATVGTPVSREVYSDFHQFYAKLMERAQIAYNDQPDNETNGYQLFEAFWRVASTRTLENFYGISQTGTGNPSIETLSTDLLPFTGISATRTGVGVYEVTVPGGFSLFANSPSGIQLIPCSGSPLVGVNDTISCYFANSRIYIKTFSSGSPTDGILDNYIFSIRIYEPTA